LASISSGYHEDYDELAARLRDSFPGPVPSNVTLMNRSLSPGGNTRTIIFGRPGQAGLGPDRVMPLREFLAENAGDRGRGIPTEQVMMRFIQLLATQRQPNQQGQGAQDPFTHILGIPQEGPDGGRIGDYVTSQQALDQIMTSLMENSNAHLPVPATTEVIDKLDHQVLEEGSELLEKQCAVCLEDFSLKTDDPDKQVVITLQCKHPFHSPCLVPWLRQNGTCPSCRDPVVPQPGSTQTPNNASESGPGPSTRTTNPPQPTSSTVGAQGGILGVFGNFFNSFTGGHQSTSSVPSSSVSGPGSVPGSWDPRPSSDRSDQPDSRPSRRSTTDGRPSHNPGSSGRGSYGRGRGRRRDTSGHNPWYNHNSESH